MTIQEFVFYGLKRDIPTLLPNNGQSLEIGPGEYPVHADVTLDWPDWDADHHKIPFNDETFDVIHAYNILEHLSDPISVLRECERVLKPGGHINITVPHACVEIAHCDLDHKHTFTEESWKNLFANHGYEKNRLNPWRLKVHANFICGVTFRNLLVFTQLIKSRNMEIK